MGSWSVIGLVAALVAGVFLVPWTLDRVKSGSAEWAAPPPRFDKTSTDYQMGFANGRTAMELEAIDAGVRMVVDSNTTWIKPCTECEQCNPILRVKK